MDNRKIKLKDGNEIPKTEGIVVDTDSFYVEKGREPYHAYYSGDKDLYKGAIIEGCHDIKKIWVCKYPVTFFLYRKIMGYDDSTYKNLVIRNGEKRELLPIDNVSWYDAILFCNELTKSTMGAEYCVYDISKISTIDNHVIDADVKVNDQKKGYRLLTDLEWEYVARNCNAQNTSAYSSSEIINNLIWNDSIRIDPYTSSGFLKYEPALNKYAWYAGNARRTKIETIINRFRNLFRKDKKRIIGPHEVGIKLPNAVGLYDMSGNIWEWVWDASNLDPIKGEYPNRERIMRGGAWCNFAYDCIVSERYSLPPEYYEKFPNVSDVGLRVCRTII